MRSNRSNSKAREQNAILPSDGTLRKNLRFRHDQHILGLALLSGFPAALIALILLWAGSYTSKVQWTLTVLILIFWLGVSFALRQRVVLPLHTLSNLLSALREGDFSIRGRGARRNDALGEVMIEVNALSGMLKEQRLGAKEATLLLRKVMSEIEVVVFAFDNEKRLRLVNRAGERLLAKRAEQLLGHSAEELGLADCLQGEPTRTLAINFPGGAGRWGLRRGNFREGGLPHQLLVLTDLSRALREEERQAWMRLVRVLGHELNNSLTPIKSIAGSLKDLTSRNPRPADWQDDTKQGLEVIEARAEALIRFMGSYTRLARLPQPELRPLDVGAWIRRVAGLETRLPITVHGGPELIIEADGDQLDQVLINLIRNAVEASLETKGGVSVGWRKIGDQVEVRVEDDGPGLSSTANLFVPFFTTKPGGSGIGLVLSRQIIEAHGGTITLENRKKAPGCEARVRLPLLESKSSEHRIPKPR